MRREVLIEHARRPNAELDSETKPTGDHGHVLSLPRWRQAHESADLHVRERATAGGDCTHRSGRRSHRVSCSVGKITPSVEEKLRPLIDAETPHAAWNAKIEDLEQKRKRCPPTRPATAKSDRPQGRRWCKALCGRAEPRPKISCRPRASRQPTLEQQKKRRGGEAERADAG